MNMFQTLFMIFIVPILILFLIEQYRKKPFIRVYFLTALSAVFVIIFYYSMVLKYAGNIPSWDDFDSILGYIVLPPSQRIIQLVSLHNEHRIMLTRIFAECSLVFLGQISFYWIIFFGNLALAGICIKLLKLLKKQNLPINLIVPLVLLTMLPSSWTNMIWATGAVQNFFVMFFALLAFENFQKNTISSTVIALIYGAIASYTSASGMFIFPIFIFWYFVSCAHNCKNRRSFFLYIKHNWQKLCVITIFSGVIGFLYFYNYHTPEAHPDILFSLKNPITAIKYFLSFMGGWFPVKPWLYIFPMFQVVLWVFLIYKRYDRLNPIIFYFMVFIFLNCLAAVITRSGFGVAQSIEPRYRIVPILGMVCSVFAVLELSVKYRYRIAIAQLITVSLAALIYILVLGKVEPRMDNHQKALILKMNQWHETGHGLYYPAEQAENAEKIIDEAIKKGVYRLPEYIGSRQN